MVVGNISFWVAEFLGRAFCLPMFLLCKEAMESCFSRLADTVRNWQADDFWFDVRSILLTQAIFYSLEWVCEPFRQSLLTTNEQTGKANSLLTIPLQTSAVQPLTWVLSEQEESEFQQTSASLTAEDVLSRLGLLPRRHPAGGSEQWCLSLRDTYKRNKNGSKIMFYFILRARTEMFQHCHFVCFLVWTSIFLKTSLKVSKTNC